MSFGRYLKILENTKIGGSYGDSAGGEEKKDQKVRSDVGAVAKKSQEVGVDKDSGKTDVKSKDRENDIWDIPTFLRKRKK